MSENLRDLNAYVTQLNNHITDNVNSWPYTQGLVRLIQLTDSFDRMRVANYLRSDMSPEGLKLYGDMSSDQVKARIAALIKIARELMDLHVKYGTQDSTKA